MAADSELEIHLDAERRAEAIRLQAIRREHDRHRGVSWSGLGPGPILPRSETALRAEAACRLDGLRAWRASSPGRLLGALADIQRVARAAHGRAESARSAAARDLAAEASQCLSAIDDLECQAWALLRAARTARAALSVERDL
jgi:hypothetical protein